MNSAALQVNIRILGGLLSAFELIGDRVLLEKATSVGELLLTAFKPGNVLPCGLIDLEDERSCDFEYGVGDPFTAAVGTLALEWRALSRHTGDSRWADRIDEINGVFLRQPILLQDHMTIDTGRPKGKTHVGGGCDSAYEYFLKQWLLDSSLDVPLRLWADSVAGIKQVLVSQAGEYKYFSELDSKGAHTNGNKFTHLQCFMGGLLIQGGELELGLEITKTCVAMYDSNPSGLACDEVDVTEDGRFGCTKDVWLNRPETVESLVVAWRATHDETYATPPPPLPLAT